MEKEYRKFTPTQFRRLVDQLPEFQSKAEELRKFMQDTPDEKWDKILTEDYSWAWVYEFPLVLHLAVAVYALNLTEWLNEVAASPDPQQRVLDDLHTEPADGFHPDVEVQHGLGLVISVVHTMQCVLLFGRSLSSLIQEVRDNNDLDCLFRAIKVDRTVVNCPTVADCIAKAELRNDKDFFRRLSNAFKGPSKKEWAGLAAMKFSFNVLRELELNDLSDDELEQLMVHTLDVYKDVPGARKNLRMHYQNIRKFKTI